MSIDVSLLSSFINMTSTPRRACLKSDYLKLKGTTFSKWLKDSNNQYIHKNLAKYAKKNDLSDSIWFKDISELQKFISDDKDEDYLTVYERCVRSTPEMWNNIQNLENKVLGCWCKPSQPCHADVLIKLFKEKNNEGQQHKMFFAK